MDCKQSNFSFVVFLAFWLFFLYALKVDISSRASITYILEFIIISSIAFNLILLYQAICLAGKRRDYNNAK